MSNSFENETLNEKRTSRIIAFFLIGLYGILSSLIFVLYLLSNEAEEKKSLLDLFKSGYLFLGGSLATIIGYYFGRRGLEVAEEKAIDARVKLEESNKEMKDKDSKIEDLAPTYENYDLPTPNRQPPI